jgi:hypothetical protein
MSRKFKDQVLGHKKTTATAVIVVLLAVVILPFVLGGSSTSQANTVVIVSRVQTRTLQQTVQLTGTLERKSVETVTAQSQGLVSSVYATDGQSIDQGQSLFALNGRDAIAEQGDIPFFRSLVPGDVGDDVLQLKKILAAAGDYPGPMNNQFTEQTQFALAQWQAQNHYPNSAPATPQTVNVQLEQGSGYQLGSQSSAGLTIGPPPASTSGYVRGGPPEANLAAYSHVGLPVVTIQALADKVLQGQDASFVITASTAPTSNLAVNLNYSGSAASLEVVNPPLAITIPAGSTSGSAIITTKAGTTVGSSTTLIVSISGGAGYIIGQPSSAQTVISNNNVPQLQINGGTTVSPGGSVTFSVTADQAPTTDLEVFLSFGGDASANSDYVLPDPVVTLPKNQTSISFTLQTLPTSTLGPDKYIVVSLSSDPSSYSLGTASSAVVEIAENNGTPVVTLQSATDYVQKGQPVQLSVSLDAPESSPLTINLAFGGSAADGVDYVAPTAPVVVPPGQTTLSVTIPTVTDNVVEPDKTLSVSLQQGSGYQVGDPSSVSVTITSQVVPKLTIQADTPTIAQGGVASFTITADQAPAKDTSVNFAVQGTAQPGQSYEPILGEALLKAGQTQVTVTIQSIETDISFAPTDMIVGHWPIRIGTVYVKAGNAVTPGEPILELTEPNVSVTLQASASDRSNLALGQHCTVEISGGTNSVSGTITELDTTPTAASSGQQAAAGAGQQSTSSSQVYEGRIDSPDLASLNGVDGSTVSITVVDQQVTDLAVPIAAVKQNGVGQDVVRVLGRDGLVTETPVQTGLQEGSYIEVKSGLKAGETVLVESDQA